ncbi:MAG: Fic family protein [Deltaproteobacteria bacterium HGW-Deltaproteobacteria-13]|jgi:Fic family protein|nr:MAG: Fic family protein [Deltaproteobacteria bacterium HGW-Deltaproteobacteria-13]
MGEYPHITFQKKWALNDETIYRLGQSECIIQSIASMPLMPENRQRLLKVSLRKGARATTAIEGNTLSEEDIEKMEAGEKLPPSKEYLQIEVQNIIDALNKIRDEVIEEEKSAILSPELIENFNRLVGQNLGDYFQAVPGKLRISGQNVVVGQYRAPLGEDVLSLVKQFCEWIRREFKYEDGEQLFRDQIVQAIVVHIYLAMIHPFGDGNGRTARLVEFYLLLRVGLPDIASHILSNHYNNTRNEYYRQLDICVKSRDLTGFINYAILGFRDGLNEVLDVVQKNALTTSWQNYIYDKLDSNVAKGKTRAVVKRRRTLALAFPVDRWISLDDLTNEKGSLAKMYSGRSNAMQVRDVSELENLGLVIRQDKKFKGNIDIMKGLMPMRKGK